MKKYRQSNRHLELASYAENQGTLPGYAHIESPLKPLSWFTKIKTKTTMTVINILAPRSKKRHTSRKRRLCSYPSMMSCSTMDLPST
jgi:hypothetical protein